MTFPSPLSVWLLTANPYSHDIIFFSTAVE
jgi:hypothetical protein